MSLYTPKVPRTQRWESLQVFRGEFPSTRVIGSGLAVEIGWSGELEIGRFDSWFWRGFGVCFRFAV